MYSCHMSEGGAGGNAPAVYHVPMRDWGVVRAAETLLLKILAAPFTRPAQAVTVAKALHYLRLLPRVSGIPARLNITLTGPERRFGEHEIFHWWGVAVTGDVVEISSGGHFYRESTGGDAFTSLTWTAVPGETAEHLDYLDELGIVDDAQPFPVEVAELDLSQSGFTLGVEDEENPLLEESPAQDEEDEGEDHRSRFRDPDLADAEERLAALADDEEGERRNLEYVNPPRACSMCGSRLDRSEFIVDGRLEGQLLWGCFCATCALVYGEGIGWGDGQLYRRQADGRWLMVAGFPPDESEW